ncbi:hypothetical protein BV25DRAFT_1917681 [Artomyces pyxidatus]|uniref:Uncharacterized protein n=1 Tax=Artomyces pyxidatus TaxID=48021 RepID=A0ACB8SXN2_9AGAM|nr:hypothetical protein BV25DRAFT_1917681 [Artomyces pyxidatus]
MSDELRPDVVGSASGVAVGVKKTEATLNLRRHGRFFFEDGNFAFTVEGILYRVHRYYFVRDSAFFASRLLRDSESELDARSVDSIDAIWKYVSAVDLDAFLSILYPLNFDTPSVSSESVETWSAVLRLATKWGFASIRRLAVRHLDAIAPPLDMLTLGRECTVEEWIVTAVTALCERPEPVSLDEARRMTLEEVITITSTREAVRKLDTAIGQGDILRRVELWFHGTPVPHRGDILPITELPSDSADSAKDGTLSGTIEHWVINVSPTQSS